MKKYFGIIFLLGIISLFIGCDRTKEIDISKYIEANTTGYQSYGSIKLTLNSEFFKDKEIFGESLVDYSALENYRVEIIADKNNNLSNDDIVNLSLKYNEELYKKDLKIKLTNKEIKEFKVSGLIKAFMVQSDLKNDDYINFKNETYEKVKKYVDSTNKSNITYSDIEFVDAFIKNPIKKFESTSFKVPQLVYLYKVNKTIKYEYTNPETTVNYIFVSVNGITLDSEGNLSNYVIPDIDGRTFSEDIKSYKVNDLPDLESIKADYLNTNDVFEKLNIL